MSRQPGYAAVLEASEKAAWRLEDVIGGDKRLDFSRPFLPESLARTADVPFLAPAERQALNHVRAGGYLRTFGLVEEFILPFVLQHAAPGAVEDLERTRALLQFAAEEAKHIMLFRAFSEEFDAGFGSPCGFIGPAEEIAAHVLSHPPLAVALVILHIEWMTQRHYTDGVADRRDLDTQFQSLLRHHWMEEAQHAKMDALLVESLAAESTPEEIEKGIDGYLAIGSFLDDGLRQQARLDADSLQAATGRRLTTAERSELQGAQHQALRWTFLGSGMTHPRFLATLQAIHPEARARVEALAPALC